LQYDDFNLSRSSKDDGPALKTIKTAHQVTKTDFDDLIV
jgi:hypothetical protein